MIQKYECGRASHLCDRFDKEDFGDAINVSIEFFLVLYGNCSFAAVGAEDNVEVGCSIAHVKSMMTGGLVFVCKHKVACL